MSEVDEPMTGVDGGESRLPLSEDETRVLELYDKLQELRLEIAIINAQQAGRNYDDESNIAEAQDALLTARARYRLRNDAIEDLFPYVQERDETSISVAQHADSMTKLRDDLTDVQVQSIRVCRQNMELTSELFALAEQAKQKKAVRVDDPRVQQEIEKLTKEVKTSRQRWRVMKGVASGVVAGSGVDWAKDEDLRNIVLDPEDED
ncbi:hypothetical protein TGAM01_v203795 [Trichoderma gamsii]|uniref:Centromere protein H C-terminal domain-containing protein n=2 Tax=Trichoderma gamsii TaxID=398673 RepID=A0A2P4ZSZ6_9HYPO|nr:hypothetical protein TGAM01_v203795 [Trichoderma gamsii]PON27414.1 hypothetical protein TGAM01_v203795 [Trichoderma gamsii]